MTVNNNKQKLQTPRVGRIFLRRPSVLTRWCVPLLWDSFFAIVLCFRCAQVLFSMEILVEIISVKKKASHLLHFHAIRMHLHKFTWNNICSDRKTSQWSYWSKADHSRFSKKCHDSVSYKTNANFCATFFLPLLRSIGDTMSKYHIYFVWLAFESGHCDVEIDTTEWLKLLYLICDEIKFSLLLQKLKCGTVIKNVLKTKAPNWEMSLCYVW